jgi:hypothetical protein
VLLEVGWYVSVDRITQCFPGVGCAVLHLLDPGMVLSTSQVVTNMLPCNLLGVVWRFRNYPDVRGMPQACYTRNWLVPVTVPFMARLVLAGLWCSAGEPEGGLCVSDVCVAVFWHVLRACSGPCCVVLCLLSVVHTSAVCMHESAVVTCVATVIS